MYQILQKFDIHWHDGGPSIAMMYHLRRVSDLLCNWKSCLLCYMKDVVLHCSIFFKWNKLVRVRVQVRVRPIWLIYTRTRWRRVKTLGQHQVGVNLQSHAQHQLWISTWHIFHEFHKLMPSLSYPVSLVNQNVILVNISHWRLHMAWIMSLMST